ncbi:MAG: hypothetical protein ABIQ47_03585 [Tepidiformaceae bacterium]
MLESARRRRFALLPLSFAVTVFAVGAAGFVATAGAPEYSQRVAALAEIVFAEPTAHTADLPESSVLLVSAAATEIPVVAAVLAEPPPRPSSPASPPTSSAVTVAAASGSSPARALDLPTALPTFEAIPSPVSSLPPPAIKGRDQTATPVSTPAGQATPIERRIVTVASTTPPPSATATAIVPRDQPEAASETPATGQPNSTVAPKAGRKASATPSPTRSTDDERGKDGDREEDDRDH